MEVSSVSQSHVISHEVRGHTRHRHNQYLDRVIIINFVSVLKVLRDEDKTGEKVTRFNPILITK